MPDSVEIKVSDYISLHDKATKFYCYLEGVGQDTFDVCVCFYNKNDERSTDNWIFSTNRKVVIKTVNYPLLLDYDYAFSTLKPSSSGSFGNRSEKLLRVIPIFHCFRIKFTKHYIFDCDNHEVGFANRQTLE